MVTHYCGVLKGEPVPDGKIPRFERPVPPVFEISPAELEEQAAAQLIAHLALPCKSIVISTYYSSGIAAFDLPCQVATERTAEHG